MVDINLLPWRDYQRVYEKKKLKRMLIMTVFFLSAVCAAIHHVLLFQEQQLSEKISKLTWQQQALTVRHLPNAPLLADEIRSFQENQLIIKKIFTELNTSSKNAVCFTAISQQSHRIIFSGQSRSVMDLTTFLTAWPVFPEVKLDQLARHTKNNLITFRFYVDKP